MNFDEWREHLLARLRRQIDVAGDPVLVRLNEELSSYPRPGVGNRGMPPAKGQYADLVVPLQLIDRRGILSLFSMTTLFGTPVDITLSELAIEAFLPADAATAEVLQERASAV